MTSHPISVTLVIAPYFPLLSLAACTESLRVANRELGSADFGCVIATVDGRPAISSSGIEIPADAALGDITYTPVAVVLTSYQPEEACGPELLSWIRRQNRLGAIICCADTGGYVLARAGILEGRAVAVHHETLTAYQEVLGEELILDRMHAYEDRLASSAGGAATLDMMLTLIARYHDEVLADRVARTLHYRRLLSDADSPSASGDDAIALTDRRLGRVVELMQSHLEEPLPVALVCRLAHVDPSTARRLFLRRFRQTPGRYYMRLRLGRARSLLANSALPIGEIATMVGFADASAFARAYRRHFGRLPSAARMPSMGFEATVPT